MPKPPLLARLLMSALRSQGGLRREVRQLNVTLRELVTLKRRELGLPAEGQAKVDEEVAAAPDPTVALVSEATRLEVVERITNEFFEMYHRAPTEFELWERVEAEFYRGNQGVGQVAGPTPRQPIRVEPPPPERVEAEA